MFKIQTFKSILKNQKGSALLMAIFASLFLMFLATSISNLTVSEYLISSQELKRVQAYYAAEGCMEISLFRIKIYEQAQQAMADMPDKSMLEMIIQFPLAWPLPIPKDLDAVTKGETKDLSKTSYMKASWTPKITSESGKIDINDLGSKIESVKKSTTNQIMHIFQQELMTNTRFSDKYRGYQFDKLINNIADWIDDDDESGNGGPEKGFYQNIDSQMIPPNQSFKTLEELHLVAEMKDDFFELLKDRITIYGIKGLNPNYATKEVFMSLDQSITSEIADKIIARRTNQQLGGFYKNEQDFEGYLNGLGARISMPADQRVPLVFEPVSNFKIECFANVQDVTRKLIAIVFDFDKVKARYDQLSGDKNAPGATIPDSCKTKATDAERIQCTCANVQPTDKQTCEANAKKASVGNTKPSTPGFKPGKPRVVFMQEL